MTDHLQPGDIWRHPGMGTLYVTDEPCQPGHLSCYWRLSGKAGLRTAMDPTRTAGMALVARLGEQDESGEWHLRP